MTTTDLPEQLALFTAADLDPAAELTWEEIHQGEEIPAYLKPRPLSNGEMDWCASKLPDWLVEALEEEDQ
jgi:hypothetical protein